MQTSFPDDKQDCGGNTLRTGKWSVEEEEYASKLTEFFSKGQLSLESKSNGKTLRSFLASKLRCDPMRISKKLSSQNGMGIRYHQVEYCEEKLSVCREELRRYEMAFLKKDYLVQTQRMRRKKYQPKVKDDTLDNHHLQPPDQTYLAYYALLTARDRIDQSSSSEYVIEDDSQSLSTEESSHSNIHCSSSVKSTSDWSTLSREHNMSTSEEYSPVAKRARLLSSDSSLSSICSSSHEDEGHNVRDSNDTCNLFESHDEDLLMGTSLLLQAAAILASGFNLIPCKR